MITSQYSLLFYSFWLLIALRAAFRLSFRFLVSQFYSLNNLTKEMLYGYICYMRCYVLFDGASAYKEGYGAFSQVGKPLQNFHFSSNNQLFTKPVKLFIFISLLNGYP